MLMIRLRRVGGKHNALYRVVVSDSRRRPTSRVLEQVGTYNPNTEPPEVRLDLEKIDQWKEKGAGVSETVRSLISGARRQ
jgi:small subunit ribosomal protein S16